MKLSWSGRIRRRLAGLLWPQAEPPAIPWTFANDGLATVHNSDFLHDPAFREAYRLGEETGSWQGAHIEWRAYVVCWAAMKGKSLEGDYVECGVARGGYARAVMEYVGFAGMEKKFWLVDTYRGTPAQYAESDAIAAMYGKCYDDVVRTFAPFPNAIVVRGTIPEVLAGVTPQKVCSLSIDLNCTEPSIAAAEHFWPRMSSGAVLVLDDYGWSSFASLKPAVDDFARRHGVQVLSLPTGQGLLFKP